MNINIILEIICEIFSSSKSIFKWLKKRKIKYIHSIFTILMAIGMFIGFYVSRNRTDKKIASLEVKMEQMQRQLNIAPNIARNIQRRIDFIKRDLKMDDHCGFSGIPRMYGTLNINSNLDLSVPYQLTFLNATEHKGMTRDEFVFKNRTLDIHKSKINCMALFDKIFANANRFYTLDRKKTEKQCPEAFEFIFNTFEATKNATVARIIAVPSTQYGAGNFINPIYGHKMYIGNEEVRNLVCGEESVSQQIVDNFHENDISSFK